jgi:hypothetical protein
MKNLIKEDRIFRREFPGYDSRYSDKISVILGARFPFFLGRNTMIYTLYGTQRYNNIDKIITTAKNGDLQRVTVIRRISLEQQFYLAFRTIARLHLNDYDNRNYKTELIKLFHCDALYKKK